MFFCEHQGFVGGQWQKEINVQDFIQKNYAPYNGDENFLEQATKRTKDIFEKYDSLLKAEKDNGGVLDIATKEVASILTYDVGYIDKQNEIIVGLQTDAPLRRAVNPFGGIRMARTACENYGFELSDKVEEYFKYRTTHNDGVFNAYTDEMKTARHAGLLTGLPDAYGRGRIIGDYRRISLYGMEYLINEKINDKKEYSKKDMSEENIRTIEEIAKQIGFMKRLTELAKMYGCDISKPAKNAQQAVQWLYFGYLGAVKEQNGAAMSIGRITTFLDIYFERDIKNNAITEQQAQEIIDDFIIKLRCVRHLRTAEYNEFFAGDPTWVTMSEAGVGEDNRHMVTKTSYRILNTLYTLCPASEPNITILWSKNLPLNYKSYCAKVSIQTASLQYENDDIMRPIYGDDYAIACCVSAMKMGKDMQFFGARCNMPKLLLLAINGGKDEKTGLQVGPVMPSLAQNKPLEYQEVLKRYEIYREWIARLYVNTMNIIHFMHDKYAYERLMMSFHDTKVHRYMAFGMSGLSIVADSLSAIKHAKVTPVTDEKGVTKDFIIEGEYPAFGNDDDRVDKIAVYLAKGFIEDLRKTKTYRNAEHTLSMLTITSNVAYGKKTGATPDGRKSGEPFAPGANPMHSRDKNGALASLNSVAKISYDDCRDGVSNTFSIAPKTLGSDETTSKNNLVNILDGYFAQNAHHLNVNVISREKLIDAQNNPQKYPNLTIRVSGYAVNFHLLNYQQQTEVINRTFHEKM